jgi:hypothetical protein
MLLEGQQRRVLECEGGEGRHQRIDQRNRAPLSAVIWNSLEGREKKGMQSIGGQMLADTVMLLEGKVGYVIREFRRLILKPGLTREKKKTVQSALTYYDNNREHMCYDEYLSAGYPIVRGCRQVGTRARELPAA